MQLNSLFSLIISLAVTAAALPLPLHLPFPQTTMLTKTEVQSLVLGQKLNLEPCSYDSGRTCFVVEERDYELPERTRWVREWDFYTMEWVEGRLMG